MLQEIITDVKYTAKLLGGVLSGFDDLQVRYGEEWGYVPYHVEYNRNWEGEYTFDAGYYEECGDPYYVCVAWKNFSHTPLPIILGDGEEKLQKLAVHFLERLAFNTKIAKSFKEAFTACAYYDHEHGT